MIDINRETGIITWDNFRLYPQLMHDEFVQQHPTAKSILNIYANGLHERSYQLAETKLDDYFLTPEVFYENNRLACINFGVEDGTEYSSDEENLWREQLADKRNSYQQLLIAQLGAAHQTNPFPAWIYNFEWGRVWSYYDYEQSSVMSGILVSYHHLISQS